MVRWAVCAVEYLKDVKKVKSAFSILVFECGVWFMGRVSFGVDVRVDGYLISCLFRKGGETAVVFVHGLGASKENFLEVFRREEFRSFTLLAADLVGFGDSDKTVNFSYFMKDQAGILRKLIDGFGVERFHLVGHSMGGAVGMELCEMVSSRVCSFINAEGNLTSEDCTGSRQIAEMGEEKFVTMGFEQFKRDLREEFERTGDSAGMDYLRSLSKATAQSMYKSSVSLVQESDSGNLLTRFIGLPFYKCYVYGEKNMGLFRTEKLLRQKGIPIFYVSKSGHAMMDENPDEFYDLILKIVRGSS
jgi:pimeloyl-ACP methyl ester carboxylesterase